MAAADGPVPVRTLAQAARLRREARNLHRYGIEMSDTTLDYGRLLERVREVVADVGEHSVPRSELQDAGVVLYEHAGTARFVDPHTIEAEHGIRLCADKIILCAGRHAPAAAGTGCGAGGLAPRRLGADHRAGVAAGDRRRGDRRPGRVRLRRARLPGDAV